MADPFLSQVNDRNDDHIAVIRGKYDTYLLPVARGAFQRIFGVGTGGRFAFALIYPPLFKYFFHFLFIDMAAIHPATGMFGIDQLTVTSVKRIGAGRPERLLFKDKQPQKQERNDDQDNVLFGGIGPHEIKIQRMAIGKTRKPKPAFAKASAGKARNLKLPYLCRFYG
jgi:hypothetical protein